MKRIIFYSLFFILVLLVSAMAHTPASFALKYLPVSAQLRLTGVSGTIWHGKAENVVWQGTNIGQVNWDFDATKLFQAKAEYGVRFGRGSDIKLTGKGFVGYGMSGPYAENLHASLPASSATQFLPMDLPLNVEGNLDLTVNQYVYAAPWCKTGQGALVWNNSKVGSPIGNLDLKTIITDIECSDNVVQAKGDHNVAQVSAAFTAKLEGNRKYNLDAWFKPGAEFPQSMKSQLRWLGNPDKQGRYTFVLAGKL